MLELPFSQKLSRIHGIAAIMVIWYPAKYGTPGYQITRQRTMHTVKWYPLVKWYPHIQFDNIVNHHAINSMVTLTATLCMHCRPHERSLCSQKVSDRLYYSLKCMLNCMCIQFATPFTLVYSYIYCVFQEKYRDTILHPKTQLATTDMIAYHARLSGHTSVSKCNSELHVQH